MKSGLDVFGIKRQEGSAEINLEVKEVFKGAGESQLQRAFGPLWERARGRLA